MRPTKKRILCVDNHASRNLAVFLLEQANYQVVTASSVADALKLAKSSHFDLFLLNHSLLGGAEAELCDKLGKSAPRIPVLFYSTVTYPYHQRQAISCGIEGKPVRPIDTSEVVKNVSRLIGQQARPADATDRDVRQAKRKGFSAGSKILAGVGLGAAMILIMRKATASIVASSTDKASLSLT